MIKDYKKQSHFDTCLNHVSGNYKISESIFLLYTELIKHKNNTLTEEQFNSLKNMLDSKNEYDIILAKELINNLRNERLKCKN